MERGAQARGGGCRRPMAFLHCAINLLGVMVGAKLLLQHKRIFLVYRKRKGGGFARSSADLF